MSIASTDLPKHESGQRTAAATGRDAAIRDSLARQDLFYRTHDRTIEADDEGEVEE
jgi:hypothetical protein